MTRQILQWPDKRLTETAQNITKINDDIRAVWDEMILVMDAMPGVGLAATQLGEMRRLAVVDASVARGEAIRMANPEVLHYSAEIREDWESSPCLPGVSAKIKRPRGLTVRFMNAEGEIEDRDLVGLWAVSTFHQIDHLAGRMYFDNLSRLKRDRLLKRAKKLTR